MDYELGSFSLCDPSANGSYDSLELCLDFTEASRSLEAKFVLEILFITLLMVVGTLGNLSFLISVCVSPRLRNPANVLLTNLALGDFIYLIVAAPFYVEHVIHPEWQFSEVLCKLRHFAQFTAEGVCVYSLTALSAERYMVLAGQTIIRSRNNRYRRGIAALFVWWISIAFSILIPFMAYSDGGICRPYLVNANETRIYESVRFCLYYALPLVAICCCYVLIARTLITSTGHFSQESQPGVQHFRARKRLALIVIVIAIFFGTFWFPYHLFPLISAFHPNAFAHTDAHTVLYSLASLTNSALNPWVVYFMSSTHRAVFMEVFLCRLRTRQTSATHFKTKTEEIVPLKKVKRYVPDSKLTSVSSI